MLKTLKRYAMYVFDPPWEKEGPDNFTLAVPEAHSTFRKGDVGWPNRPPAVVRCSQCATPLTHEFANDFIDCPDCHTQYPPDEFAELELLALVCPSCHRELEYGVRHPQMMDVPEWASCTECQYHWEYQHEYGD